MSYSSGWQDNNVGGEAEFVVEQSNESEPEHLDDDDDDDDEFYEDCYGTSISLSSIYDPTLVRLSLSGAATPQ